MNRLQLQSLMNQHNMKDVQDVIDMIGIMNDFLSMEADNAYDNPAISDAYRHNLEITQATLNQFLAGIKLHKWGAAD